MRASDYVFIRSRFLTHDRAAVSTWCSSKDRWQAATILCFFFFQAEDGIRDYKVTGVQTCALPISLRCRTERLRASRAHTDHTARLPVWDAISCPVLRARSPRAWPALWRPARAPD